MIRDQNPDGNDGLAIWDGFDNIFMDYRNESEITMDIRWKTGLLTMEHGRTICLIFLPTLCQNLRRIVACEGLMHYLDSLDKFNQ